MINKRSNNYECQKKTLLHNPITAKRSGKKYAQEKYKVGDDGRRMQTSYCSIPFYSIQFVYRNNLFSIPVALASLGKRPIR